MRINSDSWNSSSKIAKTSTNNGLIALKKAMKSNMNNLTEDRNGCVAHIVQLIYPWIIQRSTRESIGDTIPELWQDENHVLIEIIANQR